MRRLIWGFADCWKSHVTAQLYSFEASDAKSDVRVQVCLFAPDLIWQDVGDLLDTNYLHNLKAGGRERERLSLAYESLVISKNIMYRCWKWYLEMLLVRIGFCTTKSDIRQQWPIYRSLSTVLILCMLSINWRNILSWIPFGSDLDPNSDNGFFLLLFLRERGSKYH